MNAILISLNNACHNLILWSGYSEHHFIAYIILELNYNLYCTAVKLAARYSVHPLLIPVFSLLQRSCLFKVIKVINT